MNKNIFINLPVKNLEKSKEYYTHLGYTVNSQFTNETAACLVISDTIYLMLLVEEYFKTFTSKQIIDASNSIEVLTALSCESKEEVNSITQKSIDAGGTETKDPQDYGFMYTRSLQDLDGHVWEYFWMDPSHIQAA